MVNSTNLGLDNSKRIVGEEPKKKGRAIKTEVKPSRLTDEETDSAYDRACRISDAAWRSICLNYHQ